MIASPAPPHAVAAKLTRVGRVVGQEPLAAALKLPAPPTWVGVQPAQQIAEGIVKLSEVGAVANHISLMRHI